MELSGQTQEVVRKLVDSGQLEFVNGGWCMHDEAATHYIDMIDQTTLGHRLIKQQFNKIPRSGWQIDPFGHSAVQAYLLSAELGSDSLHFARIDCQDRAQRKLDKSLEVIWRGSKTFGSSAQIFTNTFSVHYNPPSGFHFEVSDNFEPVQANITRTNHIMWTMGDDFEYQYAESCFKQMDKLIHYVNKTALYSTPSVYTDGKNSANETWPLKADDYFPYADSADAYWTGYFTSRPALKRYVRVLSGYYLVVRQLEFLAGRKSAGPQTSSLGDSLGIGQHHDAITGTAKQHTTNDYAKRLAVGASEAEAVANLALSCLTDSDQPCATHDVTFSQCSLLNISYCQSTEEDIPEGKSLVVVAYNPLGWSRIDIVLVPVNSLHLSIKDSTGNTIGSQFVEMDNATKSLRSFYTKACLGVSVKQAPKYWLLFRVSVPPLGWNTYFTVNLNKTGEIRAESLHPVEGAAVNDTVEIGPGDLKMSFSLTSGQHKRLVNSKTGVDVPVQQSYLWYGSSIGDMDPQASGAYIFRPNGAPVVPVSRLVPLKIVRGPLVEEIHQQFSPWIYQVARLYKDKEHAEVEFTIGPIPTHDGVGKEVITRILMGEIGPIHADDWASTYK